ncbi:hypothetical protein L249_1911 [Ophiocordyceps polyrhachis-furcata BCC 54312]|uniref:Uncharacterized protein n=1 Tax=Ophiocordyceps polyrhachis-furcata BCC 54312 TaxID=1330021 RepID=A0A367LSI9_9HYPO|nr:hypothetical protein L249_1911 [Ophiocordyceps polyrhachis-furcata BCC 54312]
MASSQEEDQDTGSQQKSNGLSPRRRSSVEVAAEGALNLVQSCLDSVVSPQSRRRAYDYASSVASSRPILFSLVVSQLVFFSLPLLLFVAFVSATVAFAVGAAILFVFFWAALGLLLLLPALIVASSIALLAWAWALSSFFVVRWVFLLAVATTKHDAVKAETHPD